MNKSTPHLQGEMDHAFEYDRDLKLVYRCYGDPDGSPVFYFHGWPGSRFEGQLFDALARDHRCLLIAPERPGYGRSTSSQHLSLTQWADLIKGLADHLGLERFSVIGLSGGGPPRLRDHGMPAEQGSPRLPVWCPWDLFKQSWG